MSWFVREGMKPKGPLPEEDVRARLAAGDISPEDLIWKDGVDEWRPALQWPEFRAMSVPALQEVGMIGDDEKEWIVLERGVGVPQTTGPWSLNDIRAALLVGRMKATDHLWKKGMSGWARIESRPELATLPDLGIPSLV